MKFSEFCEEDFQNSLKKEKNVSSNQVDGIDINLQKKYNNNENLQKNSKKTQKVSQNSQNFEIDENLKKAINTYQNMSSQELQMELFKEVNKQKQNGTFSLQRIENMKQKLMPMLSEEQKQKLEQLIKMLG